MFCSSCGTEVRDGLKYCNRCGQRVSDGDDIDSSIAGDLTSSFSYVGGGGFFGYIFVVLVLVKNEMPPNYIIFISFFYFAALFGICFLILRQTQLLARKKRGPANGPYDEEARPYLKPVATAQLAEPRDVGLASVTEHTTRGLEEAVIERK